MITTESWLYIEPFVYIAVNSNIALLYNTLNGKSIEFLCYTKPYFLIKRLNQNKNLMVIKLNSNYCNDLDIYNFVKKVQKFYMGDVLNMFPNGRKPFQLKPIYNIQQNIKTIQSSEAISFGTKIMQEIISVSVHLNSSCNLNCKSCNLYFKQFSACTKNSSPEMSIEIIEKIFNDLTGTNINTVNVLGGNVFEYKHFESLINILRKYNFYASFFTHYKNISLKEDILNILSNNNYTVNLLISLPIDVELLKTKLDLFQKYNIKIYNNFIVECEKDYNFVENLIEELNMDNPIVLPFYNGMNISFFKRNFFSSKKDILESMPSIEKIYARQMINSNYYGRLNIMSNGDVYANVNEKKIGNIKNNSLHKFANNEMIFGKSWRKTRDKIKPCNLCVYKFLCSPISNYEYIIDKNNLCKIHK